MTAMIAMTAMTANTAMPAMTATALIEARGLHVQAGERTLLRDVALRVLPGERVALVGHNGAGKSTLLRALSGFAPVARGSLQVLGTELAGLRDPRTLRGLRASVAQVHQGLQLVGRLSAIDNVLIGGAARCGTPVAAVSSWLRRWPTAERRAAQASLARVGLAWATARRTDTLSGGERQKLAIARALHQGAPLLLADEPTASLDADAADEVLALLAELVAERGATLLTVVHDLDLLPRLADRALALRRGLIVADVTVDAGTPAQLRGLLR